MQGILLINKNKDCTSRDVVNDLVHILHTKKIGHTGTLDPIATGVLVTIVGKYTKLGELLTSTYKEYIATFELGYETDTLDCTGVITKLSKKNVTKEEIIAAVNHFLGKYDQEVPIFSSVKINGKKLYEYARNNESIELPKREVDIKEIEILSISEKNIKIRTLVSKGTYIRSLIRDIGVHLGTYATMNNLIRTKQGIFSIEDCYTIDDVKNNNFKLLDLEDVLDLEVVDVDDELYHKVANGRKIPNIYNKEFVLFKYQGEKICLYQHYQDYYQMFLMLKS